MRSKSDDITKPMYTIDMEEMIGKTYRSSDDNGEKHKVTVIKKIVELDEDGNTNDTKFLIKHDNSQQTEEIVS